MAEGKKGFFGRLVAGLTKTRKSIAAGFDYIFSGFSHIDDDFYEELEEVLVMQILASTPLKPLLRNKRKSKRTAH